MIDKTLKAAGRLYQECEQLRAELSRERQSRRSAQEQLERYKAEVTRLQHLVDRLNGEKRLQDDELAEAQKDAQRYQWLRGDGRKMAVDYFGNKYRVVDASVNLVVTDWEDSFDAAIDAAIDSEPMRRKAE